MCDLVDVLELQPGTVHVVLTNLQEHYIRFPLRCIWDNCRRVNDDVLNSFTPRRGEIHCAHHRLLHCVSAVLQERWTAADLQ